MRIGFDAKRVYQNTTGLGNYSRMVLKSLAENFPEHQYFLFSAASKQKITLNIAASTRDFFYNGSLKAYWRSYAIRKDLLKHNINIYHGLSNEIPFGLKQTKIRTVVTIHDLIFKHYPQHYSYIDRKIYDIKSKYACLNADVILAASEATKQDIIDFYNINDRNIKVVYQACDDIFHKQLSEEQIQFSLLQYNLPQNFILYVGSITERKNLLNICKAYLQIPGELRMPCLVIGNGNKYADTVKKFITKHGLSKYFIFLKNIPSSDLPAFYRKAKIFIYPSLYEGFGIPVLEAIASGCPVITSNISSLPEVAGEAALLINPNSENEIAKAIIKMLSDSHYKKTLIESGYEQIKSFNKNIMAEKIMEIYTALMK
jgi:glycosyltransferase involved in cell wall biosynthesis